MLKILVPYNWQVDNYSFKDKFKGSAQCGPTSCCIMLSAYISEASSDDFVRKFIEDMDSDWLKGKVGNRKTAFQANYEIAIEKYLEKYNIPKKVVLKPYGATINDIKKSLENGSPIMVSTMLTKHGHYICMVGIDEEKGVFIFHDPYGKFDFKQKKYIEVKDQVGAYVEYPISEMKKYMEESSKAAMGKQVNGFRIIYLE